MLDINTESVLSLGGAAKACPLIDGKRPHISTLWRWMRRGVRGVHLEHARIGKRVVTSREALARFASALAEADHAAQSSPQPSAQPTSRTQAQRAAGIRRAEAELSRAGF